MGTRANAIIPKHCSEFSMFPLGDALQVLMVKGEAVWRPCPPFHSPNEEFEKDDYTMFTVDDSTVISLRVSRTGLHIHSAIRWSAWESQPARLREFVHACSQCAKFLGTNWFVLHADDDILEEESLNCSDVAAIREHANKLGARIKSLDELAGGWEPAARIVIVETGPLRRR